MTKDEALRKAIKALEEAQDIIERKVGQGGYFHKPIQACKEALAETQEPVTHVIGLDNDGKEVVVKLQKPLYTTPPSREWVGLSDAEITHIGMSCQSLHQVARAIEAKLRENNG